MNSCLPNQRQLVLKKKRNQILETDVKVRNRPLHLNSAELHWLTVVLCTTVCLTSALRFSPGVEKFSIPGYLANNLGGAASNLPQALESN